jgi:predicted RND superfamily exporter protein
VTPDPVPSDRAAPAGLSPPPVTPPPASPLPASYTRPPGALARAVERLTRFSSTRPWLVLALAACALGATWTYASGLKLRGDFIELLPTTSAAARRFRATVERKGGAGSTLIVLVESDDPERNRRFVDAVEAEVRRLPPELVGMVEHGPEETRAFFHRHRWLMPDVRVLERVRCELEQARARMLPGYVELEDPCVDFPLPEEQERAAAEARAARGAAPEAGAASGAAGGGPTAAGAAEPFRRPGESALAAFERRIDAAIAEVDKYPTGYYRDPSGRTYALLVRSPSAGFGDARGDALYARVQAIVEAERARAGADAPEVGFGGDIPNAIAERKALEEDLAGVSGAAILLILGTIAVFFRSGWSLLHIGVAVFTGCGVAFAVAMGAFGQLNAATSFLGSIIFGNGINYGIVYLARYRERRAAGDDVTAALVDAAETCRSSTWLASLAASGAYAALTVTSFRGFSEFGVIGGVGMVACWLSTFAVVPASLAAFERLRARLRSRRAAPTGEAARADGATATGGAPRRESLAGRVGRLASAGAAPVLGVAALLTAAAAWPLPGYLADPWEYDFSKLRSASSRERGAGKWSTRANEVFQSRGSPQLLLADRAEDAPAVAASVLAADARVTGGRFVERVDTVWNVLGGVPEVQRQKLEILADIREIIDRTRARLDEADRAVADRWRPPEYLAELRPGDLPPLVREQYGERGAGRPPREGTAVYVYLARDVSQSKGQNLLTIERILSQVRLPSGEVAPNASRASVFAEMIRSMERDGPRATLVALLVVVAAVVLVTRRLRPAVAVLGSLLVAVVWTVGGAAWADVRLNFLNFVALPLTFGIGVEYAINLFERIRHGGGDVAAGVRSVGGAVFVCALTTIFGYGALLFADNLALRSFGMYAIAGEIACILTALLLLPAALSVRRRGQPA